MNIAVQIDALSIQSYIFSSNKLRDHIGASYIVENLVFDKCILEALQNLFDEGGSLEFNHWVNNPDIYHLKEKNSLRWEIGFIGGGNALIIFREEEDAKKFITEHSSLILQYFPGLRLAYATGKFEYDGHHYQNYRKQLAEKLIQNRLFFPAISTPFKFGISEDCHFSGDAIEDFPYKHDYNNSHFLSATVFAKREYLQKANNHLAHDLLDTPELQNFTFTAELEKLGQEEDKGYIAIIHADGNGMGQLFMNARSLAETRRLSSDTRKFAREVMKKLLADTLKATKLLDDENLLKQQKENNLRILPMRPIIMGGDDLTLVCDGKLGIYLAKRLLYHMTTTLIAGNTIEACAGVVMVHTKFPFYRAYKLAEEVTKKAKDKSRSGSSWLHFHISSGGVSGTLEDIEERELKAGNQLSLRYGPYVVNESESGNSLHRLESLIKELGDVRKWPRNKVKELREVLRRSSRDQKFFSESLRIHRFGESMTNTLRDFPLWENNSTPYYDAIELLDFYPSVLLNS